MIFPFLVWIGYLVSICLETVHINGNSSWQEHIKYSLAICTLIYLILSFDHIWNQANFISWNVTSTYLFISGQSSWHQRKHCENYQFCPTSLFIQGALWMLGLLFLQGVTRVSRIKSFWLVRSCLLMTSIKCLKGNKSLQLFLGFSLWGPNINLGVKLKRNVELFLCIKLISNEWKI